MQSLMELWLLTCLCCGHAEAKSGSASSIAKAVEKIMAKVAQVG
jgi:hypothetical protein